MTPASPTVALSIKQPWATLVVHGLKTIELRSWPTRRTGRIYIHTGRSPERRRESWDALPEELIPFSRQLGGIIGEATITGCKRYLSLDEFRGDGDRHRAPEDWYSSPMHGFLLAEAVARPLIPVRGGLYFFEPKLPVDPWPGAPSEP